MSLIYLTRVNPTWTIKINSISRPIVLYLPSRSANLLKRLPKLTIKLRLIVTIHSSTPLWTRFMFFLLTIKFFTNRISNIHRMKIKYTPTSNNCRYKTISQILIQWTPLNPPLFKLNVIQIKMWLIITLWSRPQTHIFIDRH